MNCPKCGFEQFCPCIHCQSRNYHDKPWIWLPNDLVSCGNCNLTLHCDQWLNIEASQMKEAK